MTTSAKCAHTRTETVTIGGVTFTKAKVCSDCGAVLERSDRPNKIEKDQPEISLKDPAIRIPKLIISRAIKEQLYRKGIPVRGLAHKIGMKHPQILRVTGGENYNIHTLLKILDGLDLEIIVQPKTKRDSQ